MHPFVTWRSLLTSTSMVMLLMPATVCAQEEVPRVRFSVFSGYTSFALGDVRNLYQEILSSYSSRGIKTPTQFEYPANFLVGGAAMFNLSESTRLGGALQYSSTKAYSGYEDYSGTLGITSKVSMYTLEGVLQHDFLIRSKYRFFGGIQAGAAFQSLSFSEDIVFNSLAAQSQTTTLSTSSVGYTTEGQVGARRRLKAIDISLSVGYRYAIANNSDATLSGTGSGSSAGSIKLQSDLSGLVVRLSVEFRLRKKG